MVALTPVAAYMMLQFPSFQSFAAKRAAKVLSDNLNTEVSVEKVYYVFFKKLILGNVHIMSNPLDTLINAHKLSITFSGMNPFARQAALQKVLLHGGVFHLELEGGRTNLERVFKIERGKQRDKDSTKHSLMVSLRDLSLRDFRFTLKDERRWRNGAFPSTMDFLNLDISHINLDVTKMSLERNTLFCFIKGLEAQEKSGYVINKLNGKVAISGTEVRILDLLFRDPWSELHANAFYMRYNSGRDFKHFVDNVQLEADFNNALLSFESLSYYAPAIENNHLSLYITGHVEGPVRYLKSEGLCIRSSSGATSASLDFKVKGLPSVPITTVFVDIHRLTSHAGDVAQILSQINGMNPAQITRFISPATKLQFDGRLAGLLTNFVANGALSTDMGDLSFDAILYREKGRGFHINGHLASEELNLEPIMGKPFGALTMHTHTHAILQGFTLGGMAAKIDSLRIEKMVVNNYPFSQILSNGLYEDHRFDGRIVCSDPNLNFIFQGLANLNYREFKADQTARYDFHADIAYADLAAIGIDSRDSISRFSGSLRANFERSIEDDVIGTITIPKAEYINSSGRYNLGAILIDSHVHDSSYRFTLSAPFAKAEYVGSEGVITFAKDLRHHALSRYLPNYFTPQGEGCSNRQYTLDITVLDMPAIGQLALPGFYIAPNTHLTAFLTADDSLSCSLRSKYIRYNEQKASNVSADFWGNIHSLRSTLSSTELHTLGQLIDTVNLTLNAAQNKVEGQLIYANHSVQNSGGVLNGHICFLEKGHESERGERPPILFNLMPSHFIVNEATWELDSSSILFAQKDLHFRGLSLHNREQSLRVDGTLAKERSDTLYLDLNQFDISLLNLFLEKSPYRLAGTFTGKAQVIDFYQNRQFSMDVKGRDVFVNEKDAGDFSIMCLWNNSMQRFQIGVQNVLGGRVPMSVSGYYYPDNKRLTLNASLQELSVAYFQPFLRSLISNLGGEITGNMSLNGILPNLSLTSNKVEANNVAFTVNYTKVPYVLNGHISLHSNGFTAQNVTITDPNGNKGVVSGGMNYRFFKEVSIDASVDFINMLCLATKEKDNSSFYGDVFATGRLHATGNLRQVGLDIIARTEKNSTLHIPLSGTAEAKQSTLLTFVSPPENNITSVLDPLDTIKIKEKTKEPTQVAVSLKADVTPDAELLIEINKTTGNVISGFGTGNISIGVDPAKSLFDIFGDYTLSSGDYQFVLQGLWSRKFFVVPAGKITFNGDILKTTLDLTAAYRTKASVSTLLANNNTVAGLREVECRIMMSGNMLNPNLGFDIDIPDLAPEVYSRVRAALTPEDKMVRQFMALLVSGGFMPDQLSGIVNNTSILYSNATDILTNQLNNIFGQLNIPLDVGFNYQPGDKGRDIYDVAISTQLFNNRVVVNGNLGNAQKSGTTNGDVAGNIDIEVKLTDNGNFRVKAFSHSADQYSNYSNYNEWDNTQRNGAGVTYQEEFNTFRELFNKIFGRNKKRYESDPPVMATIATDP